MADNGAPLILLTRPRARSEAFAAELADLSEIAIVPLQEIVPTGPLPDLGSVAAVIFTSQSAVDLAAAGPARPPAWCVGEATAALAEGAGFPATDGGGTAEALVARMLAARPAGRLLHLHGTHTRGEVVARLNAGGLSAEGVAIYDQRARAPDRPLASLAARRPVHVPLFSPRSAALFAAALGPEAAGDWRPACLSDAVRAALPGGLAARAAVAQRPDAAALRALLARRILP